MATAPTAALTKRLEQLRSTASRMEQLLGAGTVAESDVLRVYEGLYLRAITGVEAYLEETFYGIMLGRINYPASRDVRPRVAVTTKIILDDVLHQGRAYIDWLPYERTVERAKAFLRAGRPFSELPQATQTELNRWLITRHAIAHASDSALRRFEQKVIQNQALPPSQRNPVGYLRSQARINPAATQFDLILDRVASLTTELDP